VPAAQNLVPKASIHDRETEFHDIWAAGTPLDAVLVRECFESPTALENRFILALMGNLRSKRVLDIGAGLGESSVYFALHGAEVTTTDISPLMVDKVLQLAGNYGVHVTGIVSTAESLCVRENYYDFVYVANTIHHIHDRDSLFRQIYSALKPGGKFFSYDPLAYNPIINVYRRMANSVRTPDESPLSFDDLQRAQKYFPNLCHREFWISALVLFLKYFFVDRIHPNQDRYWKRILHETPETLRWWMPFRTFDEILSRTPLIRWLAWNIVMWGEKV
jgi:SAM-dependent methyltransferase